MTAKPRDDAPQLTLGIDEAGRGSVLGPLVLGGCVLDPSAAQTLAAAGLADSKSFGSPAKAQQRRAELAELIRQTAQWCDVHIIEPAQVDARVRRGQLNALEREVAARLLDDAPSVPLAVLDGKRLFGPLGRRYAEVRAMDRADAIEPAVQAASILAKSTRDRCFGEIRRRYEGEFGPISGGGYPNAATARFIRAYADKRGALPDETRRSWQWAPLLPYTTAADRGETPTLAFE